MADGATFPGASVTMEQSELPGLWQIAGWSGFEAAVQPILAELGFTDAGDPREVRQAGAARPWRVAPDRIWLSGPDLRIAEAPGLAVLDLSHSRVSLRLAGPGSRRIIGQLIPVDMRQKSIGARQFLQTGIHGVHVLIERTDEGVFNVVIPRTWAESVKDFITFNANTYGLLLRAKS